MADAAFGDPFINAKTQVDRINDHVKTAQMRVLDRTEDLRASAESMLAVMAQFKPDLNAPTPPLPPKLGGVDITGEVQEPGKEDFGTVEPIDTPPPTWSAITPVQDVNIDEFHPSVISLNIPDAPTPGNFGPMPTRPELEQVVVPVSPTLVRPIMAALDDISIPDFTFPTLPTFDAAAPEFEGSFVSTVLQWNENPHQVTILSEAMDKLRLMWAGGTGLPPAVEQALWERAASREDIAISRDVSAAATEFAGRGFTMPPGMLVNRIDTIRTEGQIRKLGLGREVMVKIADTQIENLRFACTQAIAAEQVLVSIWTAIAGRAFEAAKIQLDSQLALLNAHIAIFNARQSAYSTEATVYRAKLEGSLAALQVMKMELEAELARGTLNEQKVRVFAEMNRALLTDVELFKARMQGAQLESDLQKNQVERFKTEVQAHAELLATDKIRFDGYESRVKGEVAKAGMLGAQAQAYSAYVSGRAAAADVKIKNQQSEVAIEEMKLKQFIAMVEKDKATMAAQVAGIQASVEGYKAGTARFVANTGVATATAGLQIQQSESVMRSSIALYQVEMQRSIADMEQMIRVAGIQLEALKGAAQMSATMAAGAMAGINISSSVSGGGSISATGNRTDTNKVTFT